VLPAIAIVVAAFALGYGARLLLADDDNDHPDESGTITLEQGETATPGMSRAQLAAELNGLKPTAVVPTGKDSACLYYPISGDPNDAWVFCFRADRLRSSERVPANSQRGR
jgi:hypothetical protein